MSLKMKVLLESNLADEILFSRTKRYKINSFGTVLYVLSVENIHQNIHQTKMITFFRSCDKLRWM